MANHRKTSAVKEAEGRRAHTPFRSDVAGIGLPEMPAHLSPEQAELWAIVVSSLPVGVLTRADSGLLERYAVAWAQFRHATRLIEIEGVTQLSPNRIMIWSPLCTLQKDAAMEMSRAGELLGLSPAARARIAMPGTAEVDPLEVLLASRKQPAR